jgi:hypothetical protein
MRTLALTLSAGVLSASPALAQTPVPKVPEYDPAAEVTITGTVEGVHESKVLTDHPGLHVVLRTETETVEIHACPVRFLRELDFTIEKGDTLTIIGSRQKAGDVVVAREVRKGHVSLEVRDKKGTPNWTGR